MGSIAVTLLAMLEFVYNAVYILVLASVLISLVGADPSNPVVRGIYQITQPMFRPFRRVASYIPGPFDWSPMLLLMVLYGLRAGLAHYLSGLR